MKRILVGALVAGMIVFAWGAVCYMLLPTATLGMGTLPEEESVVSLLRSTVSEAGVYRYPALDPASSPSPQEEAAWKARYELGPRGLIVFHPGGDSPMAAKYFAVELASNILAALVAAVVLSVATAGFFGRVLIVTAMGVFGWLSILVSFWNWDGFPFDFLVQQAVDQFGGWFLGGIALAAIVRRPARRS